MPTDKLQILTPIVTSVNGNTGDVTVATKTSELENDSGFATTAYVDTKVANLVDSAPETLDTLNELSAALGDDPNFATTVANQIGTKQDKITATGVLQGDGKGNITAVESIGADIVTLDKSDVGLGNVDNVKQYSASNPPPYPVTSVAGKTGAVTLAKSDVGLGNVDNTSDANKPISTATQTALDEKQDKITASGILQGDGTGNVTAAGVDLVEITPDTIGAQSKITASGLLKGDGSGGITAAVAGTDYSTNIGFVESGDLFRIDSEVGSSTPILYAINQMSMTVGEADFSNSTTLSVYPQGSITGYGLIYSSRRYNKLINAVDLSDPTAEDTTHRGKVELFEGALSIQHEGSGIVSVTGIPIPTVDHGAANKAYVDTAVKGTTTSVTLASASWGGTAAPYTYTISNSAITTASTQEVLPSTDITADQLTALQEANIIDGGQAAGSMTLKAFGEKPSIDIPIRVVIKG